MAEKDLAQDMKQKEHNQKLLEKIRKIEDEIKLEKGTDNVNVKYHEKCVLTIAGKQIEVTVAEIEEEKEDKAKEREENDTVKTFNIYIGKVKIGEINEEGKLILDEDAIKKIDPNNELGLKELGEEEKPDISEINRVEGKSLEELEEEIDYSERENIDTIDEEGLEESEEELEEKSEDEKIDKLMEIEAEKQGISKDELKANMLELELDTIKVTENKTLRHILGIGNDYTRVFAVPGRDASEYTIQGLNKEGKLEILENLKQVEGTNPNQPITELGKDGKQVETKSTIAMFELKGQGMREGLTISKGQLDYKEVSYYRRVDDNKYLSTTVAQKNGVDRDESTYETKRIMDKNETEHDDVKEYINTYEKLEDIKEEKVEVPDKVDPTKDGIQYEDIVQGKEIMIENIIKNYDYNKEEATIIVNNIIDKNMDFDKAREETDNNKAKEEEEHEERTQGGDAWDRRMNRY